MTQNIMQTATLYCKILRYLSIVLFSFLETPKQICPGHQSRMYGTLPIPSSAVILNLRSTTLKNIITLYLSACLCLGLRRVWFESPFRVDFIVFLEQNVFNKSLYTRKIGKANRAEAMNHTSSLVARTFVNS